LIYSIMSQSDYSASQNIELRISGKSFRPEAKGLRIDCGPYFSEQFTIILLCLL
jgi:hypothetical protein